MRCNTLLAGLFAFVLSGCAAVQTSPSPETRQALAPTGKLRVGFLSATIYATKDPATGEIKGIAADLGAELARRLGVPFEPVLFPNPPAILAAAKSGALDVALMGINPERAEVVDFSAPYMEVEQTYLVRSGANIAAPSDVDKAGIRVAVLERGGADVLLSTAFKNATLVRVRAPSELFTALDAGKADAVAATTAALAGAAEKRPGSRLLEGRILAEPVGMGTPKGRDRAAAVYVNNFVKQAKAEGVVKSAIAKAGLRGVVVAP